MRKQNVYAIGKTAAIAGIIIALIIGIAIGYFAAASTAAPQTITLTKTQVSTVTVGAGGTVTVTQTLTQTLTPTKPVVKLGILLPLTGGAAESGHEDLRGIQLLAKHVNEGAFPEPEF